MDRWRQIIDEARAKALASGIDKDDGDGRAVLAYSIGMLAQQVVALESDVRLYRDRYQQEMDASRFLETEKVEAE